MAGVGRGIGKDRQLARRFLQAGELKLGISGRQITGIVFQRIRIGGPKIFQYGPAPPGVVDDHEPPGLAQAH